MTKWRVITLVTSLLITLVGCTNQTTTVSPTPLAVRQASVAGAEYIQQGSQLTVILPTDTFFVANTSQIKKSEQKNLRQLAKIIVKFANHYPNSAVVINGYTNDIPPQVKQIELTQAYATTISGYLWNAGLDTNRLVASGKGSSKPIATRSTVVGLALNRRVEIYVRGEV